MFCTSHVRKHQANVRTGSMAAAVETGLLLVQTFVVKPEPASVWSRWVYIES